MPEEIKAYNCVQCNTLNRAERCLIVDSLDVLIPLQEWEYREGKIRAIKEHKDLTFCNEQCFSKWVEQNCSCPDF